MTKQPKPKPYYVPRSIQKLFIYTIGLTYSLQTGLIAFSTITQAFDGSDYRPQLGYLFSYMLLPIIAFVIAYLLNPRKLSTLSRLFESLLITVAGHIAWSVIVMFLPMLLLSSFYSDEYRFFDNIFPLVFILLFSLALFVVRARGVWK